MASVTLWSTSGREDPEEHCIHAMDYMGPGGSDLKLLNKDWDKSYYTSDQ